MAPGAAGRSGWSPDRTGARRYTRRAPLTRKSQDPQHSSQAARIPADSPGGPNGPHVESPGPMWNLLGRAPGRDETDPNDSGPPVFCRAGRGVLSGIDSVWNQLCLGSALSVRGPAWACVALASVLSRGAWVHRTRLPGNPLRGRRKDAPEASGDVLGRVSRGVEVVPRGGDCASVRNRLSLLRSRLSEWSRTHPGHRTGGRGKPKRKAGLARPALPGGMSLSGVAW